MIAVKHARVLGCEPNGSHTERSTHDALAELGARVLETMRSTPTTHDLARYGGPTAARWAAVYNAARDIGLISEDPRG
jgi:hypothetical protein